MNIKTKVSEWISFKGFSPLMHFARGNYLVGRIEGFDHKYVVIVHGAQSEEVLPSKDGKFEYYDLFCEEVIKGIDKDADEVVLYSCFSGYKPSTTINLGDGELKITVPEELSVKRAIMITPYSIFGWKGVMVSTSKRSLKIAIVRNAIWECIKLFDIRPRRIRNMYNYLSSVYGLEA